MAAKSPPAPTVEVVDDFSFRSPHSRQLSSPHYDNADYEHAPPLLLEPKTPPSLSHAHDYNFSPNIYDESFASATDREHDEYTTEEEGEEEEEDIAHLTGTEYRRNAASSRSSISSLPASIIVTETVAPQVQDKFTTPKKDGSRSPKENSRLGSLGEIIQLPGGGWRGPGSGFRNPSSVRALQMRDETVYDDDLTPHSRRLGSRLSSRGRHTTLSPRSGTPNTSPSKAIRSHYHTPRSPSSSKLKLQKEFPLVLLHCNLLPPSLSLPLLQQRQPKAIAIDPALLRSVLPTTYWRRWKMLEDKIGAGNCEVRSRGVLISHPKAEYDLLEERLLESLELERPRLRTGHFLGAPSSSEEEAQGANGDIGADDDRESTVLETEAGSSVGPKCPDCGTKVPQEVDVERKWELKVYAANGLMRAGAWAAAWGEMEEVDIEVAVWLPEDVRREIEGRLQDMGIYDGVDTESEQEQGEAEAIPGLEPQQAAQEHEAFVEQRRREIYGSPTAPMSDPTQEKIDGLFDDVEDYMDRTFNENEVREPGYYGRKQEATPRRASKYRQQQQEQHPSPAAQRPVDLQVLMVKYLKALAQDKRNVVIAILGLLVLFFYASSRSSSASARALSAMGPLPVHPAEVVTSTSVATATVTTTAVKTTTTTAKSPPASKLIAECMSSSSLLLKSLEEYITLAEMPRPTETVFRQPDQQENILDEDDKDDEDDEDEPQRDTKEEDELDKADGDKDHPSLLQNLMDSFLGDDEPVAAYAFSD